MLPNDNVSVSVGRLDHVLLTVYSSKEHVACKSPGPGDFRPRAPSSYKQSRHDQDVRRTL